MIITNRAQLGKSRASSLTWSPVPFVVAVMATASLRYFDPHGTYALAVFDASVVLILVATVALRHRLGAALIGDAAALIGDATIIAVAVTISENALIKPSFPLQIQAISYVGSALLLLIICNRSAYPIRIIRWLAAALIGMPALLISILFFGFLLNPPT
jgi:hypothetical protein